MSVRFLYFRSLTSSFLTLFWPGSAPAAPPSAMNRATVAITVAGEGRLAKWRIWISSRELRTSAGPNSHTVPVTATAERRGDSPPLVVRPEPAPQDRQRMLDAGLAGHVRPQPPAPQGTRRRPRPSSLPLEARAPDPPHPVAAPRSGARRRAGPSETAPRRRTRRSVAGWRTLPGARPRSAHRGCRRARAAQRTSAPSRCASAAAGRRVPASATTFTCSRKWRAAASSSTSSLRGK